MTGTGEAPPLGRRLVLLRDLAIFGLKILLDGLKDVVLIQIAVVAVALDILFPTGTHGKRFYTVLRKSEQFDRWLNLYHVAEKAQDNEEGLLGATVAGADSLIGKIESMVSRRGERGTTTSKR
ncbi:MAG: hypothetical protein L0271_07400 [Gemmatimonadetes bacterium]|nr:hypothetical protein [Gemmatimonadota bacterium]